MNQPDPTFNSQNTPSKGMPGWAKFLIGFVIVVFLLGFLAVVGLFFFAKSMVNKVTDGKGGLERMIEKGIEQQIENETGQKTRIDFGENGVVVKDETGQQQFAIGPSAKLPQNFPADVPVFQPSQVVSTADIAGQLMVGFETSATPDQIASFYQAQLTPKGWQAVMNIVPAPEGQTVVYNKGEQSLTLGITKANDGKNAFMIHYGAGMPDTGNEE